MSTDRQSRGGVLEPEGTVEIKFRQKDVVKTMARLDPQFAEMQACLQDPGLSADKANSLRVQLGAREEDLSSTFHQVAVEFADLHDTPGRMQKKGCVAVGNGEGWAHLDLVNTICVMDHPH